MKPPAGPLFLARRSYRRRRLGDAARLLPILGAALFCLPLLGRASTPRETSGTGIYLFLVWLGLIIAAALIGRGLGPGDAPPGSVGQGDGAGPGFGEGED
jgi:hypothetical protein